MALKDMIGDFGLVLKVNVSDLEKSVHWYSEKLGFVHNPRYDVPGWWAQLTIPELRNTAVGLNFDAGKVGTGGGETTFVVADIERARDALIAKGVDVGPIQTVPTGVKLANFHDPDGNALGLRQNPHHMPQMWQDG